MRFHAGTFSLLRYREQPFCRSRFRHHVIGDSVAFVCQCFRPVNCPLPFSVGRYDFSEFVMHDEFHFVFLVVDLRYVKPPRILAVGAVASIVEPEARCGPFFKPFIVCQFHVALEFIDKPISARWVEVQLRHGVFKVGLRHRFVIVWDASESSLYEKVKW